MATIRMSEAEGARDFAALMDQVRAGAEVVIEKDSAAPVLLRTVFEPLGTPLSKLVERAAAREEERGHVLRMTPDFAEDMRAIVAGRKPRDTAAWDD
jgi:hypothetical protein